MRKLSLLLAIVMVWTVAFSGLASAETAAAEIVTVSATDSQVRLGTTVKELIEVDGLQFKDLNGNGAWTSTRTGAWTWTNASGICTTR